MIDNSVRWYDFKPWTRQGKVLVVAGLVYIFYGFAQILTAQSDTHEHVLRFALNFMSYDAWGAGFVLVGVISAISARWPSLPKSLGYALLTGWSAGWGSFYIIGAVLTSASGFYYMLGGMWCLFAFLWWGLSGLVEPPDPEAH